ncbi:GTP 3',8-cyclase MoaA [Campylobacter sp. MIT 99-7217]|uniref:GTP 3',8-cyclase MoaA n=1 Tax=Campylobacter sp. MIT 99-7217 TaxID=535091 RepID=UPI00115BCF98|nr:GTP 3',8-cyclase MoaA [Campylobacter sp. MIT 99-7217]TQR30958.1 GTP 3',8-cyclase MoaA [Campylobacter sp. MIT 99-7217]
MLIDSFDRHINYLRISLTQTCNFRCLYCMPKLPFDAKVEEKLLSFEELFLFVKACIDEGINKIRITGGEPLLRQDLEVFIKMIYDYAPQIDLAITTNAFLLEEKASVLKEAGLKRMNISLDTLDPKKAKKIAQKDVLEQVLRGIQKAKELGFFIKLNTVVLKGINDDELVLLLDYAKNLGVQIRFIEFMENHHAYGQLKGLNSTEILTLLKQGYPTIYEDEKPINSPVSLYRLEDGYKFGIIDPHSDKFCNSCNRIRLTAEGFLIPCLYFDEALSIKKALKQKDIPEAVKILKQVVINKPEKNKWSVADNETSSRAFYQTGG